MYRFTIYASTQQELLRALERLRKLFTITKISKPYKAKNSRFWRVYVWCE